jgi:transposase
LKKENVRLKYLPAYSPDLNPIEHCQQSIKHAYAGHQHRFQTPADAIDFAVSQYNTTT